MNVSFQPSAYRFSTAQAQGTSNIARLHFGHEGPEHVHDEPQEQLPPVEESPVAQRSFLRKCWDGVKTSAITQGLGIALDAAAVVFSPLGFPLLLLIPGVVLNLIGIKKFINGYKGATAAPQEAPSGEVAPPAASGPAN